MISTVLFDIDGTLVDSNDAHAKAWVDVLGRHGHPVTYDAVRPLIGMGGDKLLPKLTGLDPESPEGHEIAHRRASLFKEQYLPHLRATAGAYDLVAALSDAGLTLGIATSAKADEVKALLRVAGVDQLFDAAGSSDDVERSKPDPDIVHAALTRSRGDALHAVMIGDTPYDVEAARHAGLPCLAVRCGGWWSDDSFAGALQVFDDPRDLLGRWRAGSVSILGT